MLEVFKKLINELYYSYYMGCYDTLDDAIIYAEEAFWIKNLLYRANKNYSYGGKKNE